MCSVQSSANRRLDKCSHREQRCDPGHGWLQSNAPSAERDHFRLAAASPALDSSGGDLPPISQNTKATAEGDDEGGDNSAQEIDGILAKV